MKKFNRAVHKTMGEMPPVIRQLIGDADVAAATAEFNEYMSALAMDFHSRLADDIAPADIELKPSKKLFGQKVSLKYIASGSVGSVYKMTIGDNTFAFKINRRATTGELAVMPMQKRVRGLVNKTHIGSVFEFNGRKYSWVISDFIENNRANGFESAMEKLYFAYITKGVSITDAHPNNFKDGRLIDTPSLGKRQGEIDDIKNLTRVQVDIVKKLAYCIKTDDMPRFQSLVMRATTENPAVITYMFFAMKYAKRPTFAIGKTDDFSLKLRRYEEVINSAKQQIAPRGPGFAAIAKKLLGEYNK